MTGHVLDACTLLNLYCGWGGISDLRYIPTTFHLPPVIAAEVQYVRDQDSTGKLVHKKLTLSELLREHSFQLPVPATDEIALSVVLSRELDDGESQGLAIAEKRGFSFCSDDAAVRRLVKAAGLRVPIASTADLLKAWAAADASRLRGLPNIVRRITHLAKFTPHATSLDHAWWHAQLACADR